MTNVSDFSSVRNDKTSNSHESYSPFVELDRPTWARLAAEIKQPLNQQDIERLRGLGDKLSLAEVAEVYLPISRLLNIYVQNSKNLRQEQTEFLKSRSSRTPFVIGVGGSVAVGKSTTARVLQEMLRRWPNTPRVELVTTDGFLFPNRELRRRGLMERKGFPESYDRRSLLRFVSAVKSGANEVEAPVYSHLSYDIVPGERIVVHRPDVLIVEGLNVLQPAQPRTDGTTGLAVSDFFDFTVYVDAKSADIKRWYIERFMKLREGAFTDPDSYFHRYSKLDDEAAVATANAIWERTNGPNLRENVITTRGRSKLVLVKDQNHSVSRVLLRKI
ncbi:type I pantothenate kinase [Micrococcoides hystricis]|uniref:Pantothenate kinase n=1 Tax=Micrococcoides hystricis TaxID=1572761 RepID=A0ABV6P9W2_9MICC